MADLDESVQDNLLDAALDTSKDEDAVLGDVSHDLSAEDAVEDPVISLTWAFVRLYRVSEFSWPFFCRQNNRARESSQWSLLFNVHQRVVSPINLWDSCHVVSLDWTTNVEVNIDVDELDVGDLRLSFWKARTVRALLNCGAVLWLPSVEYQGNWSPYRRN